MLDANLICLCRNKTFYTYNHVFHTINLIWLYKIVCDRIYMYNNVRVTDFPLLNYLIGFLLQEVKCDLIVSDFY